MTSDLSSLATLQLNDSKDVNDAAQRVRRSTIPRESGGGDDTKSHAALVGSRRDAAHSGKGLHQLAFCSPHNHYVRQLMLGHRYTQLKVGRRLMLRYQHLCIEWSDCSSFDLESRVTGHRRRKEALVYVNGIGEE